MFEIPSGLSWLEASVDGRQWLRDLPSHVTACVEKWGLRLEAPYRQSYVSLAMRVTSRDGSPAVLKIQYPHRESDHEHDALRMWNGNGAVQLFDYDADHKALLLERCEPGEHLSMVAAEQALDVLSSLLPRLWINAGEPFRSLSDEAAAWIQSMPAEWEDGGKAFELALLDGALDALERLRATQGESVLLHQDLHAENVLRAAREPWLVIDPKPLAGEREFSLAPIIRSSELGHGRAQVVRRLDRLAAQLHLDRERARLWTLGQTLAWSFGSVRADRHIETARWLWEA